MRGRCLLGAAAWNIQRNRGTLFAAARQRRSQSTLLAEVHTSNGSAQPLACGARGLAADCKFPYFTVLALARFLDPRPKVKDTKSRSRAGTHRRWDGANAPYERFAKQNLGGRRALPDRAFKSYGVPGRAAGPFGECGALPHTLPAFGKRGKDKTFGFVR